MNETAADFRAQIARDRVPIYKVAAAIDVHPSRLSAILHEHVRLTPDIADRLRGALCEVRRQR